MNNISNLHSKVHTWLSTIGFRLNTSQTNKRSKITTNHYFFETFNLLEKSKWGEQEKSKYLCFDMYGEKINVRSLLDLQTAFFENISQLK
ncbi:hypothetical protein [Mucilaginibacter auburnensis]|uniref:Uncharacterized protein n=1 Tax=Mucilaginibacter auburnensis TaxID=1457233 RepID=A0A2H9VS94_9SPHI|nr:hypothetical protein [Mucilaginibacter auburnensis]PJJ83696.1 hypothetical protein CLV57_0689 [Mucilaginibacter auburnensis]